MSDGFQQVSYSLVGMSVVSMGMTVRWSMSVGVSVSVGGSVSVGVSVVDWVGSHGDWSSNVFDNWDSLDDWDHWVVGAVLMVVAGGYWHLQAKYIHLVPAS